MSPSRFCVILLLGLACILLHPGRTQAGERTICIDSTGDSDDTRCALWRIVHNCMNPGSVDYCTACRTPMEGTSCEVKDPCRDMLQVWDRSPDFVSMRDRKMCGCRNPRFTHGLVLPLWPVTGDEDAQARSDAKGFNPKLAGIWRFAWDIAQKKIGGREAMLVVNPPGRRTQDQLHIHIVRRADGAREKLLRIPRKQRQTITSLDDVWTAVSRAAKASHLSEYGIAVVQDDKTAKYLVVVVSDSPEEEFTDYACPK